MIETIVSLLWLSSKTMPVIEFEFKGISLVFEERLVEKVFPVLRYLRYIGMV